MEERNIATKKTWKNFTIVSPKKIEIKIFFSDDQFAQLTAGLIPHQMEDKWFIYYEDNWLYFHRSWTGFGIYKTQLIKTREGYVINEFWVERDPKKYKNDNDKFDIETLSFLIDRGLLGIDIRNQYASENIQSEDDSLKGWRTFGNLLFSNQGIDSKNDNDKSDSK